jgi:thiol reductant ABC exporter CydC subunit
MMMFIAYILGAFAFIGGIGLTVSSGWLITMASSHPPILTLGVAIVLVRFFGIFRSVARYCERVISHKAVFDRLTSLRVQIYSNLARMSISTSSIVNSGPAVKSLVDDVERAQEYQLRIKLPGASAVLAVSAGTLLGWWVRAETLIVTLPVSLALLLVLPAVISRGSVPAARNFEYQENEYTKNIESAVHGIVEARIYGYLEESYLPSKNLELDIKRREISLIKVSGVFSFIASLLVGGSIAGSAFLAFSLSEGGDLPAVQIAMMIFLPLVMFEAITAWYPNLFGSGKLLASQRAVDLLLKQEISASVKTTLKDTIEKLACVNVQVSWDQEFMQPISCEVSPGQVLAIRGNSGSGKSTFAMGLLGLLPYKGSIQINGHELSTISNLHEIVVGTVQKSHIFNTSARENLKIANPAATDAQIMDVLKALALDSLISEMDNGLDTIVGEFGRAVSGGEAKRLAIARVLLANAQIYIFDEPTEHLNEEISHMVMEAIERYCQSAICIVITHSDWEKPDKTLMLVR